MSVCQWCRRKPAGDGELLLVWLGQEPEEPHCWRKFNPNDDCFAQEERVKAAAPDLLEALEDVLQGYLENGEVVVSEVKAAIAKAKGGGRD